MSTLPSYSHSSGQGLPEGAGGGPGSLNSGPLTSTLTEVSFSAPTFNSTGLWPTGSPFHVVEIENLNSSRRKKKHLYFSVTVSGSLVTCQAGVYLEFP